MGSITKIYHHHQPSKHTSSPLLFLYVQQLFHQTKSCIPFIQRRVRRRIEFNPSAEQETAVGDKSHLKTVAKSNTSAFPSTVLLLHLSCKHLRCLESVVL